MFRALYDWTLRLAHHRHAVRSLAVVSFAESSVFPIPPDVMLVPMILARRDQAYRIATICTITSVAGGMLGYAIGYFLYDSVGLWLVNLYGAHDAIAEFRAWYDNWGAAVILIKGLTPIPFKVVTIASGLDPHGLGVPEVFWMRRSGDYGAAARGFASGTPDGLAAWLVLSSEALRAGAKEALSIAEGASK